MLAIRPADHRADSMAEAAQKVVARRQVSDRSALRRATNEWSSAAARGKGAATTPNEQRSYMSILINKDTKVITQGITGKTGQFHTRMCRDYANGRERVRRRREPEEGRRRLRRHPDLRDGARGEAGDRRDRLASSTCRRRSPRPRSRRPSTPISISSICITEGIPVRDMIEHARPHAAASKTLLLGPNCPGVDHARRDQDRHHAGPHPPQGPHRRRVAFGHAHLRSGRRS